MKEIGKVYSTTNYDLFELEDRNRKIDPYNLSKLLTDMRENFFITIALIVKKDGKLLIRDGQHRLECCRILKQPYYFTILSDYGDACIGNNGIETLAALQRNKPWTPADYLHYYAAAGQKDMQKMLEFMEETGMAAINAHICLTGKTGVAIDSKIKRGHLIIKDIERAYALADIIREFEENKVPGARNPKLTSALFRGLMAHSISLKKLRSGFGSFAAHKWVGSSVSETLGNLERYSLKDRSLKNRHIEFQNPEWKWSYSDSERAIHEKNMQRSLELS